MTFEELLESRIDLLPASDVREAMRYSLMAGGKRIRPKLLYAVCSGYGVAEMEADPFACALEMIHTYSLIHDDLPAMDNDDLRRGRPTCHKQFDEATAILAGDGLLTYAFETAASSTCDAAKAVRAISVLAEMAGPAGMVLGQCLDMEEGESDVDWKALQKIHACKTGCLLSAPLMIGAILAGRDQDTIRKWHEIGTEIGLAFQVQDDILDVTLTAEEFGKSNSDERNEKVTSVTLLGLDQARSVMFDLYADSKKKINEFKGFDGSEILNLIDGISKRNK